ncbi:hypothetical protein [Actinoplanes utahensis]|uniref:Uncharacterized protein n=1 Tax=Actinoplanes utahensis TaxID=1869 RepID=A0A0A6URK2_ACTUT|nr:hypothetical protein [Actinoplanes utahensis]KHD77079.1 hypothetical protein MB27_13295 [Actinoplanes utahensis]GIF33060.1 hypothetical protein Aut01nite_60460 [Actinoplanes utahensis]
MTEARCRQLLALYPRAFRREYEEEMITVLLAEARTGPAQVFDLVRAALTAHLRALAAPGGAWREAARVVWFFGAILLFALTARRFGMVTAWAEGFSARVFPADPVEFLRLAGWAVALGGAVAGRRSVGLLGAVAGLAGEIIAPARLYLDTPAMLLNVYWVIVAAVLVLIAVPLAGPAPGRMWASPGRIRGWLPVVLAGLALIAQGSFLRYWPWMISFQPWTAASVGSILLLTGASAVLVVVGVARQAPAVRRRLVVWSTPVLVTLPLIITGFGDLVEFNMRNPGAERLLGPGQWAALVLIPVATFAVTAEITRRWEAGRRWLGGGPPLAGSGGGRGRGGVNAVSSEGAEDR